MWRQGIQIQLDTIYQYFGIETMIQVLLYQLYLYILQYFLIIMSVLSMQQLTTHIPFETAIQLVNTAVMYNVQTLEECKEERDFDNDMEISFPHTVAPGQERLLDAIHVDDDTDETRLLIWVQCRRCK